MLIAGLQKQGWHEEASHHKDALICLQEKTVARIRKNASTCHPRSGGSSGFGYDPAVYAPQPGDIEDAIRLLDARPGCGEILETTG